MAQAHAEARKDLLTTIAAWDEARRIQAYFDAVEQRASTLDAAQQGPIYTRIAHARALIGAFDPMEALLRWKAPEER